ncbi:unnamed protein product, partial [Candidula unifasciata]
MANIEETVEKPRSKKIFLNRLDSFQGRNIGRYLSRCVIGASLESPEEDDDIKSVSSSIEGKTKEGCYEIVGTVKNTEKAKSDFAKEIIQATSTNPKSLFSDCSIIVFFSFLDEVANPTLKMHSDLETIEKSKTFILISTCMTWAKSKTLDP